MSKATKFRDMSVEELLAEENQIRTDLFNLRVGNTTKELEDTSKIRSAKRELARVLTILGEKSKEADAAQEA